MVSITSKADKATGVLYPMGSSIGAMAFRFRDYGVEYCDPGGSQRKNFLLTGGHNVGLHSHAILRNDEISSQQIPESLKASAFTFAGDESDYTVIRRVAAWNRTPYWIMRVPAEIISGHSDIFGTATLNLLEALLQQSGSFDPNSQSFIVRAQGFDPIAIERVRNGDMLSLTRERRIYLQTDRDTEATFLLCLPATLNVENIVAFYVDSSNTAHFVVNRFDEEKNRNQLWLHSTGGGQDEEVKSRKLAKARNIGQLTAGAYDQLNASYYFAAGNRVYKLDSGRRLKFVTEVDGARNIYRMRFLGSSQDLLLLDDLGGNLYRLSMTDNQPRVQQLASGLARPISMIADAAGQQVYVGESLQPRIKRFTCDATGCDTGVDLVTGGALQLPISLALGKRDELWVADPESNAMLVYDKTGQLLEKIDERPGLH